MVPTCTLPIPSCWPGKIPLFWRVRSWSSIWIITGPRMVWKYIEQPNDCYSLIKGRMLTLLFDLQLYEYNCACRLILHARNTTSNCARKYVIKIDKINNLKNNNRFFWWYLIRRVLLNYISYARRILYDDKYQPTNATAFTRPILFKSTISTLIELFLLWQFEETQK